MSHPYVESFLKYRQYRLQAAANRAGSAFFSGPTLGGFAGGTLLAILSNFNILARFGIVAATTLLGLAIDMGCRANPIDFLNRFGTQLDSNFRECMKGKKPNDCNFTNTEIEQMAQEIQDANKEKSLFLTPQEIFLLPSKVVAKIMELESAAPTPIFAARR
jgi:arginine/lysine/ornithine decarboxylase